MVKHYESRDEIVGYDVRYRYANEVYVRRMDRDPGEQVRVRVQLSPQRR